MSEWYSNPIVWTLIALAFAAGAIKFWYWRGQVDSDRASFKDFMNGIKDDIAGIRTDIKGILDRMPPSSSTVSRASPLRLTELGEKISVQIGARAIVEGLVPSLRARVAGKQPYEIQELCFAYVRDEYKPLDDVNNLILQCAFDNGIDREEVLRVIAIELRDQLLPEHLDTTLT